MWSEKEREQIKQCISALEKCNGDCKHCKNCTIKIAGMFYSFYCGKNQFLREKMQYLCSSIKNLKAETIDALRWEIS